MKDFEIAPLLGDERELLLRIAVQSIRHGLRFNEALAVDISSLPLRLQLQQACFVSLHDVEELRGCVGTLEARQALGRQVADSAYDAAFRDSRLVSVEERELVRLTLEISVLSEMEEIEASAESDLFRQLRPGIDGVVVREGERHATFLPKVWETFELPFDFVEHLKRKAGLPPRYWSPALRWQRYTVDLFGAAVADVA